MTSEPGAGTTVTIYLPRFVGETIKVKTERAAEPMKGRGETILLVDDEGTILKMGKTMLERLGYMVYTASTPSEALCLAQEHSDEIDLLITDVVLPEMNGRTLAEQVSLINPAIKCLYMSGYTADVVVNLDVLSEGARFIQKPFLMNNLASKVRMVLDQI